MVTNLAQGAYNDKDVGQFYVCADLLLGGVWILKHCTIKEKTAKRIVDIKRRLHTMYCYIIVTQIVIIKHSKLTI